MKLAIGSEVTVQLWLVFAPLWKSKAQHPNMWNSPGLWEEAPALPAHKGSWSSYLVGFLSWVIVQTLFDSSTL